MQFDGIITYISNQELVGQNQVPKITVVFEEKTDKEYKESVGVDFMKDKTALVENLQPGMFVRIYFNTSCREYNGKYYNSFRARKIEDLSGGNIPSSAPASSPKVEEDLPF
jgi:hypothetical protein